LGFEPAGRGRRVVRLAPRLQTADRCPTQCRGRSRYRAGLGP
jgi:hypothetical protein